jgi:redox-sensitive bicupin YhaK (pirin superfamily)
MKTTLHRANTRGHADHGWLNTHHTFSFANYYDPERVHFGNLRVLNDDVIAPGTGFGKHPHDNMEIITIPISGTVLHQDSMGHKQTIGPNEVQVMSAGTGIFHSEYNASGTEELSLLQIWIFPEKKNIKPVYDQVKFDENEAQNRWQFLVNGDGPLKINQQASISRVFLTKGHEITYSHSNLSRKSYVFLIDGEIEVGNIVLQKRDGLGLEDCSEFNVKALKDSYLINIEV